MDVEWDGRYSFPWPQRSDWLKYLLSLSRGTNYSSEQKNRAKQNNARDISNIDGAETRFNNYAKKYFKEHNEKPTFEQQIKENGSFDFIKD
jgi:hypothetical protein